MTEYTNNELVDIVDALGVKLKDLGSANLTSSGHPDLPTQRILSMLHMSYGIRASVELTAADGTYEFKSLDWSE